MCFHSRAEYNAYIAARKRQQGRGAAGAKHAKSAKKYGLIVLRDAVGEWVAGWHCDPRDPQDVANTILDLKTWHADEFRYVDTSDVDKERARLKLKPLDQDGLPLPDRPARASADDEVDAAFKELTEKERTQAGMRAIDSMERKRKVAGRPVSDAGEITPAAIEAAERRALEREALAKELGVSVEELEMREREQVREVAMAR